MPALRFSVEEKQFKNDTFGKPKTLRLPFCVFLEHKFKITGDIAALSNCSGVMWKDVFGVKTPGAIVKFHPRIVDDT